MTIKAHFEAAFAHITKRESYVLRIESDKFKICEPKVVKTQKYVFAQRTFIVHYSKKGKIRTKRLN